VESNLEEKASRSQRNLAKCDDDEALGYSSLVGRQTRHIVSYPTFSPR